MDENNISEKLPEEAVKKEAVPPTVEILPDLDSEAETDEKLPDEKYPSDEEKLTKLPGDGENSEKNSKKTVSPYPVKRRGISPFAFIMALIFAVFITFMLTFVLLNNNFQEKFTRYQTAVAGKDGELAQIFEKIRAVDSEVRQQYLYDIDSETLEDSIMKGYLYGIGDKYSEYFTKDEMKQLVADSNAEMQGIGIVVIYNSELGALEVATVYEDSPAQKAGLLPGDLIAYIKEGDEYVSVSETGYTMSVNKLRGDAGTKAEFGAFRDGDYKNLIEFSIERGFITEITVTYEICELDKTVGVISIASFDSKTPEQFKKAIDELIKSGAEKLVFDVRNNPGGELDSICAVLDMLLPEGPVIRTVDKAGNEEVVYTSDKEEIKLPMAVIANGSTASAAELFTSALKDYKKATVVGEKTYGKGSMQTIQTFVDGTGFKYTYRYYCPPYSDNYDGVGIKPDVEVQLSEESQKKNPYTLPAKEDDQLVAALKTFDK